MDGKKVPQQGILGQLGANLIERIVLEMGYIWRPTAIFDVGVDGEIEIRDPVSGVATGAIFKVQAKATSQPFQAETAEFFEYTCSEKDLDYWLRGNVAVVLVICRPQSGEAYWISIKDYFQELSARKSRKIHFDKARDCFDAIVANKLKELALPKDSGLYFAPLPKAEPLYSNLLQVSSFAPSIYIAETEYRKREDVWGQFNSMQAKTGSEWILANKRIISFRSLDEPPFNTICDLGTCEAFDSTEWAESNDVDRLREFVRLLNASLRERMRLLGLHFYQKGKLNYFHFPATKALTTRKVRYRSIQLEVGREVFKAYGKKSDPSQRAYCRHSAFSGDFVRTDNKWYLEISPTYHFTSDGYLVDRFREERLSGIKRLERNPAVLGHLLMWVSMLQKPIATLFAKEYPFLSFGSLEMLDIDIGLPDEVWYAGEEGEDARSLSAIENQQGVLGL